MLNSYILTIRILNPRKQITNRLIHNLIILILSIFLIDYFTGPFFNSKAIMSNLQYSERDIIISNSTAEQFDQKLNNINLKSKVAFNASTVVALSHKDKIIDNYGAYYTAGRLLEDSLDSLFNTVLTPEQVIDYDKSLFHAKDAIVINFSIASELGLKVGDKIRVKLPVIKETEFSEPVDHAEYTIAAIYDDLSYTFFDVVLFNESLTYQIDEDIYYSFVYVDFYDKSQGISDMKDYREDYILFSMYGKDWQNIATKQEIDSLSPSEFIARDKLIAEKKSVSVNNPVSLIFFGVMSISAISLLFLNEKR